MVVLAKRKCSGCEKMNRKSLISNLGKESSFFAIAPAIVLVGGDSLLVGITGMAGIVTLAVINIVLALFGNTAYWHNQSVQETPLRVAS